MSRALLLYEDLHWRALRPLTDLLPVPALAFGASDLARRWLRVAGLPLAGIEARAAVLEAWWNAPASTPAEGADEIVVINAAALPGPWFAGALEAHAPALWLADGRIAGARVPRPLLDAARGLGDQFERVLLGLALPALGVDAEFLSYPWQMVEANPAAIAADLAQSRGGPAPGVHASARLEAPGRIVFGEGAEVGAFAVLDARPGPILVGRGVRIAPHTVVTGPCAIGPGTQLLGGSIAGCTIGPGCRIAGEVEATIWQGFSNKRHHGFVGHSVIGEWVNLGALTTTSDLKNNYGSVRVHVDSLEVDSGQRKVGSIVGGHVKTGIGTLLPTGASVGIGANLFGGGRFAPRAVPAFGWWDGERMAAHELVKFVATARIAMQRRGRTASPADETLWRQVFDATAAERRPAAAGTPRPPAADPAP